MKILHYYVFTCLLVISMNVWAAIPPKDVKLSEKAVSISSTSEIYFSRSSFSKREFSKVEKRVRHIAEQQAPAGVTVEDIVAFVGVIIMLIGAISLIFNPWGGLVTIIIGLAIFLVGKALGGDVRRFFR